MDEKKGAALNILTGLTPVKYHQPIDQSHSHKKKVLNSKNKK